MVRCSLFRFLELKLRKVEEGGVVEGGRGRVVLGFFRKRRLKGNLKGNGYIGDF